MKEKVPLKTVLIAMTGGLESTVSAYLLKKQGYRCIGIGIQFFEPGSDTGPFSDVIVSDLNKVKDICVYLDIPFYAVNASVLFAEKVLDPVVGRILSGHTFEPMIFLNYVVMEVLLEKTLKFNAEYIASAHYAKVLKNQKTGAFELMVANDLEQDQSYMLSALEQRHLIHLMLPLSEIRKQEVTKIGELIKVNYLKRPKASVHHMMRDPRMIGLVEERSSKDLRRSGTIYDYNLESSVCDHTGCHRFYVGQKNIPSKLEPPIDPDKEVILIIPFKGNIFIDFSNRLKYQHALIYHFQCTDGQDMTLPLSVYVKMSIKGEKIPCLLYFKNNNSCLVDFGIERPGLLVPGQMFVFYNRSMEKGKVLGSGMVEVGGVFNKNQFNTLPKIKRDFDEKDEAVIENDLEKISF